MFTNEQLWHALDTIIGRSGLSIQSLFRQAGLDPSAFTPAKRVAATGRRRWPSTESISKILRVTDTPLQEFCSIVLGNAGKRPDTTIPVIGLARAGKRGRFSDAGAPVGDGWNELVFPGLEDEHVYALDIVDDSMEPVYRDGDVIIVSPGSPTRRGDRVVMQTGAGELLVGTLKRKSARTIELAPIGRQQRIIHLRPDEVGWTARILWVSR